MSGQRADLETIWQRRTGSFRHALVESWRSYRLVPHLFAHARRLESMVTTPRAFGGFDDLPTPNFTEEGRFPIDGMAKQWGRDVAFGETRALLDVVRGRSANEPVAGEMRTALYGMTHRATRGDFTDAAIIAPLDSRLLRSLELDGGADLTWLPGEGARSLYRGSFEGIPVFAQDAEMPDLWVIDFGRIGRWQHAGTLDDLRTHAESLRDTLVPMGDARVPATKITVDAFFEIVLDDPTAARGVRIAADDRA